MSYYRKWSLLDNNEERPLKHEATIGSRAWLSYLRALLAE
jgi:hypothetical protein